MLSAVWRARTGSRTKSAEASAWPVATTGAVNECAPVAACLPLTKAFFYWLYSCKTWQCCAYQFLLLFLTLVIYFHRVGWLTMFLFSPYLCYHFTVCSFVLLLRCCCLLCWRNRYTKTQKNLPSYSLFCLFACSFMSWWLNVYQVMYIICSRMQPKNKYALRLRKFHPCKRSMLGCFRCNRKYALAANVNTTHINN